MLTRDEILRADDLSLTSVEVPEWGGAVYVRALRAGEREQLERQIRHDDTLQGFRELVVATAVSDGAGEPLFSQDDLPALAAKNGAVVDRLAQEILRLSGMGADAVEEAEKNSAAALSDGSGSVSR